MNRIDRLFGVLTLLQAKKYVTADAIAEKFRISVRTVYRDIRAVSELGIPVSFEQSKGYFLVQGYLLPPLSFTSEEVNALLMMETLVYGFADRSVGEHYSTALSKIRSVLKSQQKEKLEQLDSQMMLQLPDCFENGTSHLSELQSAITSRTILEIDYTDLRDRSSKRRIEPIGLIFYAFGWHLISWCHLRSAYRDFKVTRIVKIRNLHIPFSKSDHMELKDYMANLTMTLEK